MLKKVSNIPFKGTKEQMEELLNVLAVSDEDILIKVEKIIRTIQSSSRESAVLVKLYNAMTAENDPRFASQFAYEMESMTSRIYRIAIVPMLPFSKPFTANSFVAASRILLLFSAEILSNVGL